MPQLIRNPDDVLIALFKNGTVINEDKSAKAGRPIHDDREICEIRVPGSRDVKIVPAHELCTEKIRDPYTGEERSITYAERFSRQYAQFKAHADQTRTGTPLDYVPFLTEAKRVELRGFNIYTVEALAHVDGQELKNLGPYGRDYKNQAEAYMENAKRGAPAIEAQAELDALRARNMALEEDNAALQRKAQAEAKDGNFESMSIEQLRDYITTHSGHAPHGSLSLKVLQRMAKEIPAHQPEAA